MPRARTSPAQLAILSDVRDLLFTMCSMMACPDCDGTGRIADGNRLDGRPDERCSCRDEAEKLLDDLERDDEDDEDE